MNFIPPPFPKENLHSILIFKLQITYEYILNLGMKDQVLNDIYKGYAKQVAIFILC